MFWNERYARDGWAIESGQYEKSTRGRLPDWYVKQPPLIRGDDFYLTAFTLLSTERSFPGNGIGPIPWSKAWDYGCRHALPRRMCNYFAMVILILDGHYREHLRDEQQKDADREARSERRKTKSAKDVSGLRRRRQAKR